MLVSGGGGFGWLRSSLLGYKELGGCAKCPMSLHSALLSLFSLFNTINNHHRSTPAI